MVGTSPLFGFNYVDADTIASFLNRRVEVLTVEYLFTLANKEERKEILDYIQADDLSKISPMEYLWKYVGDAAVKALSDNAHELTLGAQYLTAKNVNLKETSIVNHKDLTRLSIKEREQCETYRRQAQSVINNIAERVVNFINIDREIWLSDVMHRLTAAYLKAQPSEKRNELLTEITRMLEHKEQSPFIRFWTEIKSGVQKELLETYQAKLTAEQIKEKAVKPSHRLSDLKKINVGDNNIDPKTQDATECAFQALIDNYAKVPFSMKEIEEEMAKLINPSNNKKRRAEYSESQRKQIKLSGNRYSFHSLSASHSGESSGSDELKIDERDVDMNDFDTFGI